MSKKPDNKKTEIPNKSVVADSIIAASHSIKYEIGHNKNKVASEIVMPDDEFPADPFPTENMAVYSQHIASPPPRIKEGYTFSKMLKTERTDMPPVAAGNVFYGEDGEPEPGPKPINNYPASGVKCKPGSKRKLEYASGSEMCPPSRYHFPKSVEYCGTEFSLEDLGSVKDSLKISKVHSVTTLIGVIFNTEDDGNNQIISVKCSGGRPFSGYIYDYGTDSYLVRGITVLDLGKFDFAFRVSLPGIEEWSQPVPIPDDILEKHFSAAQRRIIEENLNSYPRPRYQMKYIQMVD